MVLRAGFHGTVGQPSAQVIDGSLKFDQSKKTYLKRTPGSAGNRRTWTYSAWIKRGDFASSERGLFSTFGSAHPTTALKFGSSHVLEFLDYQSGYICQKITSQVFRDTGWYHIVVVIDTTLSTAADRYKLYVNGERVSSFGTNTNISSQNQELDWNSATEHNLFMHGNENTPYDGMGAQTYFIDGAALGPENFGFTDPLTNTWKPKKYNHRTDLYGVTWSSALVGDASGFQSAAAAADGFNGKVGTDNNSYAQNNTGSNPSTITFTPVGGIKFNSSIQVYLINAANTVNVNGEGAQSIAANQWVTVKTGSGTLNTLVFSRPSTSGASFGGIRIDGHILIDAQNDNSFYLPMDGNSPIGQDKSGNGNNWTPVNFGGSVALDIPQVSGARPILNTTQGGTQAGFGVFGSRENVGYAVTYYDDGGGNKYYIDGVKQATLTGLIRGATYTFNTVALGSTHPFRLSATSAHGTEYTNGVVAVTGTATTITIPYDAPETLYYYCTAHSGMGASITGITTNEKLADQYASNIVFASPLVGANNDVCASVACTMTNKTVTSNGNAAAANEQSNFYAGSFVFDGTGDYLNSSSSSDLSFGTGDFTVECWVYQTSGSSDEDGIFQISTNSAGLNASNSNTITLQTNSGAYRIYANDTSTAMSTSVITDKWVHLAVVRDSGTTKLFVNGIQDATTISDSRNYSGTYLAIGGYYSSSYLWVGYIQDFRVYKGLAKYTSNFVVPSPSPDILPDTPSGVSGGSKLTKITEGAVNFDGSGDYLDAGAVDTAFGSSSDWTLELFIYPRTVGLTAITDPRTGDSTNHPLIWIKSTGVLYYYAGGADRIVGTTVLATNKWHHVAAVRSGGTTTLYLDGKSEGSFSDSLDYASTTNFRIGQRYTSTAYNYNGFISNLRLVNGTALYTGPRITPPAAPLTNVTNTKLLCCQSNIQAGSAAVAPSVSGTNDGREWSHFTSASGGFNSSYPKYNLFDGEVSPRAEAASNDVPINIDFSPALTVSSTISIHSGKSSTSYQINNSGSYTTYSDAVDSYKDISFSGTLTNLKIKHGQSGQAAGANAIKIDGTVLTDAISAVGDVAATNFTAFNTDINAVRGQETGYCTLNPLRYSGYTTSDRIFTDGNLRMLGRGDGVSNFGATTGKFYAEVFVERIKSGESGQGYIGVIAEPETYGERGWPTSKVAALRDSGGGGSNNFYGDGKGTTTTTWTEGDTISVAFDADAAKVWIAKNGQYINGGNPSTGATPSFSGLTFKDYYFLVSDNKPSSNPTTDGNRYQINFGQKPFKYAPPDGYQPLNAANTRPVKVISRPDQYVGITTWKGDDQASHVINDLNFNGVPDFVWIKRRDGGDVAHQLYDTIRGATKPLSTTSTAAEDTQTSGLIDFVTNGFELGASSVVNGLDGDNSNVPFNYVAWCWKAGGNKNTFNVDDVGYATAAAAGLTGGSITPTAASVGTKQGFSIIKYTGNGNAATIPHGLSQTPTFIIKKFVGGTSNWDVWTPLLSANNRLLLNSSAYDGQNATTSYQSVNTATFDVHAGNNDDTVDMIAYLWHDVPGLQKFGKYEGNNSSDGTYIELGFRPALIWVKNIDAAANWKIIDAKRDTYNPSNTSLNIDTNGKDFSNAENNTDILSNGFKLRSNHGARNASNTYIYCAWAEAPAFDLYGGQSNAR